MVREWTAEAGEQATFIVRLTRGERGGLTALVERVRTGEKVRVERVEHLGRVLLRMLRRGPRTDRPGAFPGALEPGGGGPRQRQGDRPMTCRITNPIARFVAGALTALGLSGTAAEALDRRLGPADRPGEQALRRARRLRRRRRPRQGDPAHLAAAPASEPFSSRDAAAIDDLDSCLNVSTGGRHGWRLPSIHELNSLVVNQVLPAGHPFLDVRTDPSDLYWSATVRLSDPAMT